VIDLLKEVGEELDELNLDGEHSFLRRLYLLVTHVERNGCFAGNILLTDRVLSEGIKPYCPHLRSLSLASLIEIEPYGFETLFSDKPVERPVPEANDTESANGGEGDQDQAQPTADQPQASSDQPATDSTNLESAPFTRWASPGLTHLNLHRCIHLSIPSLLSLLSHSGPSLTHLNLHSLDELDASTLFTLAEKCPNLKVLDLSFVRSVDNFVVGKVWESCKKLECLFVHGNNRVTSEVPRKVSSLDYLRIESPVGKGKADLLILFSQRDAQLRGLENAVHSEIPSSVTWET